MKENTRSKNIEKYCIMGVDINPSSSPMSRNPQYAVIVLCGDKILSKHENVGLERIVRLAWEQKVRAIATDNPFELARNKNKLIKLINLLPDYTELIQVNLIDGIVYDFRELLKKMGFVAGKLTPTRTAYYLALLASQGIGTKIVKKEARTKIIIRRNRSGIQGGMSSNRFKRKVRTAVLQITNSIKKILDQNNFDYDLLYRKTGGGLEGAVFTVYAPRSALVGLVKPKQGTSVSIELRSEYTINLVGQAREEQSRPLIVGLDPGLNTGLAILDINGNPLYIGTKRQADRTDIINIIKNYGNPIIIATDVTPVPEGVRRIASLFNASLFTPDNIMSIAEKQEISLYIKEKYGIDVPDNHSRDALAAAYNAYRHLSAKLSQVDKYISETGLELSSEKIKQDVIMGKTIAQAIEEEIKKILDESETRRSTQVQQQQDDDEIKLQKALEEINLVKKERQRLYYQVKKLEEELVETRKELEKAYRLRKYVDENESLLRTIENLKSTVNELSIELREKNEYIQQLSQKIDSLVKSIREISLDRRIPVPVLPSLTRSNLNKVLSNTKPNLLYIENPDVYQRDAIEMLDSRWLSGVLVNTIVNSSGLFSVLRAKGIPVININGYNPVYVGDTVLVDREVMNEVNREKENIMKELEDIERQRIFQALIEYKSERVSMLKKQGRT